MATQAILYTLDVGGNAARTVPGLAQSLGEVERKAKDAQVAASKIGGGSSLTSARAAFNGIADESKKAAEGAFKFAGMLAIAGLAINKLLEDQAEWQNATGVLRSTLAGMADDLAEAIGPTAADKVGKFTIGLRFLASFAANGLVPALLAVYDTVTTLVTDGFGALLTMLEQLKGGDILGAITTYTDTAQTGIERIREIASTVPQALTEGLDRALGDARETWQQIRDQAGMVDTGAAGGARPSSPESVGPAIAQAAAPLVDVLGEQVSLSRLAVPATEAMTVALDEMARRLDAGAAQARLDAGAGQVMGALGGLQGGLGGVVQAAGAGPVGAAVAAVAAALPEIPGMLTGLADQVLGLATNLPNTLTTILMDVVPQIVEKLPLIAGALVTAAPRMVAALVAAIPELIAALITAGPQILIGIIDAFKELPKAFFQAIQRMVVELPSAIGNALMSILNPFKGKDGNFLGTDLTAGKGESAKLFGIKLPSFDTGGVVTRTGAAKVHAGERVLNPREAASLGRGGGAGGITIGSMTVVAPDPRRWAEELRRLQGSYGVGLSLDPLVG